jgi:molybdopterin molybdotransferase
MTLQSAVDTGCLARTLIPFDQAAQIIASCAAPLDREKINLDHGAGRVLAQDIVADRDFPSRAVSAMDGYAVRDGDLRVIPTSLPVTGASFAGHPFDGVLTSGHCIRVFTGAVIPHGTERVVIQEDVREEKGSALFHRPPAARRHIRAAGSDFLKGDVIVPGGSLLTPQALIGAAAANCATLTVYRKPLVAIICCGDELVSPGEPQRSLGKIPESISYGVSALVQQWGGLVVQRCRKPDDLAKLREAAETALASSDIVVIIAGASVGDKDFAKAAFTGPRFEHLFGKVAIRPGKPVWFGRQDKCLVLGLPGNPSSAMVTARLFLAPLVAGLSGRAIADAWDWRTMRSASLLDSDSDRDIFQRATIKDDAVMPVANQDSASQANLARATHLIRCRAGGRTLAAGAAVETLQL